MGCEYNDATNCAPALFTQKAQCNEPCSCVGCECRQKPTLLAKAKCIRHAHYVERVLFALEYEVKKKWPCVPMHTF
eukprot:1160309-Pelagomonas_calceolata.AAC.3